MLQDAPTVDQKNVLFDHAIASPYFFLSAQQAQIFLDEMMDKRPDDVLLLMAQILPQIVNEAQCVRFIDANLNELGKLALRAHMGYIYNLYVGNPTGHYCFDLKNKLDITQVIHFQDDEIKCHTYKMLRN